MDCAGKAKRRRRFSTRIKAASLYIAGSPLRPAPAVQIRLSRSGAGLRFGHSVVLTSGDWKAPEPAV